MEAHLRQSDSTLTGHYTLHQRDVAWVMLFSGLMGLFLGIATGWQVAVESAQVVAGIVQYPRDNPFAMYHLKTWTLLHQVPAAMLALGIPERAVALAIAGLTGMISFMALALCAYACGASRLLASMVPVVLLGTGVYGEVSSVYPIRILSNAPWVLYGCFGTSLALLIWSMIAVGLKRSGALLMGLMPAIHPTLGAWCLGIGGLAYLWTWRRDRAQWRAPARALALGLAIAFVSLAIHLYLSRDVPDIPAAEKAQYIAAFAANWDSHRRAFPMDHMVVLMTATGVVFCGLWLRFFRERLPQTTQFLLWALLFSAAVSVALCASTQWQLHLPTALLMAMPARFINLTGLAFPALCLGLLYRNRPALLGHLMLAGFLFYLMLAVQRIEVGRIYVPMPGLIFLACSFAMLAQARWWPTLLSSARVLRAFQLLGPLALAALATMVGLKDAQISAFLWTMFGCTLILVRLRAPQPGDWLNRACEGVGTFSLWASALMMLGIGFTASLAALAAAWAALERPAAWRGLLEPVRLPIAPRAVTASLLAGSSLCLVGLLGAQVVATYPTMSDWHNHAVYAGAHRGQGMLLTASNIRATQLRTRRPVLLEGPALNQLPYVPESGPSMNRVLRRVYGEDLLAAKPPDSPRGGGLDRESGRELWEAREPHEWQALAREFGFTQIVTYSTWKLKLPLVAREEKLSLYTIPSDDNAAPAARVTRAQSPQRAAKP
jgi:hypothetical protein